MTTKNETPENGTMMTTADPIRWLTLLGGSAADRTLLAQELLAEGVPFDRVCDIVRPKRKNRRRRRTTAAAVRQKPVHRAQRRNRTSQAVLFDRLGRILVAAPSDSAFPRMAKEAGYVLDRYLVDSLYLFARHKEGLTEKQREFARECARAVYAAAVGKRGR